MARKIFRRFLPDAHTIRSHRSLQWLADFLHDPNLWHLNRRSVAGGAALGLFWAFVPIPMQMIPATAIAIWLRVNLPITLFGVWLTNVFTAPPAYYFCYLVGTWVLGTPAQDIAFNISWNWLRNELARVWQPFLLGSFIVSSVSATLGYVGVRLLWRWHVVREWEQRKERRARKTQGLGTGD
jgi:hypothetical protein